MKIIWSNPAVSDLDNIKNYIAKDSQYYASIFIEKILEATDKLLQFPLIGRIVPEFNNQNVREIIYQDYRIIYKVSKAIFILTVIHGGRNLTNWLKK